MQAVVDRYWRVGPEYDAAAIRHPVQEFPRGVVIAREIDDLGLGARFRYVEYRSLHIGFAFAIAGQPAGGDVFVGQDITLRADDESAAAAGGGDLDIRMI